MAEEPRRALDEWTPRWVSPGVSADSTLAVAASVFVEHLGRCGTSANTVAAFAADLRLFCRAAGCEQPVGQLTRAQAESFCQSLQQGAGEAGPTRSLRRRMTALRAMFRYLAEEGAIDRSLCQPVPRPRERAQVEPPLSDPETARLLEAARQLRDEGDARALLLALLVLDSGLTKSQCLDLRAEDFDLASDTVSLRPTRRGSGAGGAARQVRPPADGVPGPDAGAQEPAMAGRVLPLTPELKQAFLAVKATCPGEGTLFRCTGRNLEYVLARAGERAGLERNPSFRLLRATSAARMLARGDAPADVAAALGISPATWPAMRRRLRAKAGTAPSSGAAAPAQEPSAPTES